MFILSVALGAFIALWLFTGVIAYRWHYNEITEKSLWMMPVGFVFFLIFGPFILTEIQKDAVDQLHKLHMWEEKKRHDESKEPVPVFKHRSSEAKAAE